MFYTEDVVTWRKGIWPPGPGVTETFPPGHCCSKGNFSKELRTQRSIVWVIFSDANIINKDIVTFGKSKPKYQWTQLML